MSKNSANDRLDRLLVLANDRRQSWIDGPLDVLSSAHKTALRSYNSTMADQKKVDDLQAELAIMLLFVAAGALATVAPPAAVMFGSSGAIAWKKAGALTSRILGKNASEVGHRLANRTIVKVVWKSLGNESRAIFRKHITEELKSVSNGIDSGHISSADPETVYSVVKGRISSTYSHIVNALLELRYSDASDEEKLIFARDTEKSPFLAPVISLEGAPRKTLLRRFELVMYLDVLMSSDFETKTTKYAPMEFGGSVRETTPILVNPSDKKYPKYGVSYEDVGNVVAAKINDIFAEEYTETWGTKKAPEFMNDGGIFNNVNSKVVSKAEKELERLLGLTELSSLIPIASDI